MSQEEYLHALEQCQFGLSPWGWGYAYTHRTIECLLRGTIPILADPEHHDPCMRDGVHCVLVRNNNWIDAIRRALEMPISEIARMRSEIIRLCRERLVFDRAALQLREAMQLDAPANR